MMSSVRLTTLLALITALTLPFAARAQPFAVQAQPQVQTSVAGTRRPTSPPAAPSLAGTWRFLPALSTDLTPWQTLDLVIAINGPLISITDKFATGNRSSDTVAVLDLSRSVSVVPMAWWPDNRHIGAYIGGDRTERVHATWLDDHRILRTDADLVLDTEQGSHAVNILTDYKVSPGGTRLTVVQLRSSREIPIVYVFKRVSP